MAAVTCREEGDVSKWEAMRDHKTLQDFPCPREGWAKGEFRRRCYPELEKCGLDGECSYELVYRQYMALRAVVEAELDGATLEQRAKGYRNMASQKYLTDWQRARATKRAKAWEGIA